ncbi:hypothetical protein, partial [Hymenobacter coccineus]|uniref:hypothetical protein n=1 Tax=Hymenobacter coccineus TaxID=1908235 RepID=UPI0019559EA2
VYSRLLAGAGGPAWAGAPGLALALGGGRVVVQGALAAVCYRRAGLRLRPWLLPLFEGYTLALTLGMGYVRLFGGAVVWKGRRYD